MSFQFQWPYALLLLVVAPLLVWKELKRGHRSAVRYSSTGLLSPAPSTLRRKLHRVPLMLRTAALILLAIALARPRSGSEPIRNVTEGVAIQMVLDAYEKALREQPRPDHRHRIAHCIVVNPQILGRIKSLGVVVLPFSTYIYEHGEKMVEYGRRISMMFAHRSFLDHGIPVGGSSDNPCATQDPLLAIRTMATRLSAGGEVLGPEQRVSAREAIRIYTMGSAYAAFEEGIKGSIEPGKLADFVILSGDPTKVPPAEIHDIVVEKTYVDGREVYSRD